MAAAPISVQELARSMAYKNLRTIGAALQNVMLDIVDATASTASTPTTTSIANEIGSIDATDAAGVLTLRLAARATAPTPEIKEALLDILDCVHRLHTHQLDEFVKLFDLSSVMRIKDRVTELQTLCSIPAHRLEGLQDAFSVVVLSLECVHRDVLDE